IRGLSPASPNLLQQVLQQVFQTLQPSLAVVAGDLGIRGDTGARLAFAHQVAKYHATIRGSFHSELLAVCVNVRDDSHASILSAQLISRWSPVKTRRFWA